MLNFQQKEIILQKYIEILKLCPLFYGIEENEIIKMLSCLGMRLESFEKKQTIFSKGSFAKCIGVVLTGSVQVSSVDYCGNRNILSVLEPSAVFGEEFACAEKNIPVSIIADEDSDILFIDCNSVLHTCSNHCAFHQQLIFNLMKDLAEKTVIFHERIEVTSKRTTREKLMAYLMLTAEKKGKKNFNIPFDRQELADYLEVDRSGLSAEIGKMTKEGIIKCRKNYIEILELY